MGKALRDPTVTRRVRQAELELFDGYASHLWGEDSLGDFLFVLHLIKLKASAADAAVAGAGGCLGKQQQCETGKHLLVSHVAFWLCWEPPTHSSWLC